MTATVWEERALPVLCIAGLLAFAVLIAAGRRRNPDGAPRPLPPPVDTFPHPFTARNRSRPLPCEQVAGRRSSRRPREGPRPPGPPPDGRRRTARRP